MQITREQFDADRVEDGQTYSTHPKGQNVFNVNCGICNRSLYVEKDLYASIAGSVEKGIDNPFICDDCSEEYVDMEHSANH